VCPILILCISLLQLILYQPLYIQEVKSITQILNKPQGYGNSTISMQNNLKHNLYLPLCTMMIQDRTFLYGFPRKLREGSLTVHDRYCHLVLICYQKISELCSNFNNMSDKSKFYYLFTNEDLSIISIFWKCMIECLETRKLKQGLWYWNIFSLSVYIIKKKFKALNPTRNIVFIYYFLYIYMYNCLQWQYSMYAICLPLLWAHWLE
jgi:hypothetical protein